jgi:MoaA/NifB/PqqE/SkfB family radical SAM enzyme
MNPYSNEKVLWHTDSLNVLRAGRQPVHKHMYLILSDLCNQDCHFCHHRASNSIANEQFAGSDGSKNPNRKIPTEKAKQILSDFKSLGGKAVQFTGGGEITVHPDHIEIIRHALAIGLECGLVTNLTRLAPGWEGVFPGLTWIRISLDAGTSATYASIRKSRPEVFDKVLSRVQTLVERCPETTIGISYVVTNENYSEIAQAAELAAGTGVSYIRYAAVFSELGADYYPANIKSVARMQIESARKVDSVKTIDKFDDFMVDLDQGQPDYEFCGFQQFAVYVGGNQKVYRCCTTSYTMHGEVGDLTNQSYATWFRSHQKVKAYRNFSASSCNVCHFNDKNRNIISLLEGKPDHVNFV